jgi:hypothetical protein
MYDGMINGFCGAINQLGKGEKESEIAEAIEVWPCHQHQTRAGALALYFNSGALSMKCLGNVK